jgi:hypothetical protein
MSNGAFLDLKGVLQMTLKRAGARLTAIAGVAAAVLAATPGPVAAATGYDISVQVGPLTMRPAPAGGYVGAATLRISYSGPEGASAWVEIDAPEGLYAAFPLDSPFVGCANIGRFGLACGLSGELVSGQTREVRMEFSALAAPTRRTRPTLAGSVTVTAQRFEQDLVEATPEDNTDRLGGLMIGTGPGFDRRPYRPADTYDLSATAGSGTITFAPNDDGFYVGRVPLTLRAGTDAYHQGLYLTLVTDLPGQEYLGISPPEVCGITICAVPGDALPEGRTRTVTALVEVEAPPAPGTAILLRADTNVGGEFAADADPADNTVTVTVA